MIWTALIVGGLCAIGLVWWVAYLDLEFDGE